MQTIQKMYCPSCGAPISFEDGRDDTFCSHCGSQLYREDDKIEVKMKHQEVMAKTEVDRMYAENMAKEDKNEFIMVIVCGVFLLCCLIFILLI